MSKTPSSRRREGREAFAPNVNPSVLCPYTYWSHAKDWVTGWREMEGVEIEVEEERHPAEELLFELCDYIFTTIDTGAYYHASNIVLEEFAAKVNRYMFGGENGHVPDDEMD